MSASMVWGVVFVGAVAVTVGLVLWGWREADRAMEQAADMLAAGEDDQWD